MNSVTKSFRIILRCLPRNCIFFSLRALETFCGVKESWSSARGTETDIFGKSCFKMNLTSEIGKTARISELTSIATCSRYHVLTDCIALFFCIFNTHSPQFFLNRSDSLRWPNYILNSVDKTKIYCRGTTRNVFKLTY